MRYFGPTQGDIWKILSKDMDAEFIATNSVPKEYQVVKKFKYWTIILDTYKSGNRYDPVSTRLYCNFYNKHGIRFKIFDEYFKNYFTSFFDMEDIKINIDLKRNFIIRSNSKAFIKSLFENPTFKELVNIEDEILIEVNPENYYEKITPNSNSTIELKVPGVIKNNEYLKNLFELMVHVLLEIEKINEYETIDINNFSHFDVVKSSMKNVVMEHFPYDKVKENITNKIKFKNKFKTEENPIDLPQSPNEILIKEALMDEPLSDIKTDNLETSPDRTSDEAPKSNTDSGSFMSDTRDLNEYLNSLSVFNINSDDSKK